MTKVDIASEPQIFKLKKLSFGHQQQPTFSQGDSDFQVD